MLALAIDVGGTFTDVVAIDLDTFQLRTAKVLGDGASPADAIRSGIERVLADFGAAPRDVELAIHGTTIVSNALLERTGATTGLLTTEGFRDILETRTEKRYDLYDFNAPLPDTPDKANDRACEHKFDSLTGGVILVPRRSPMGARREGER